MVVFPAFVDELKFVALACSSNKAPVGGRYLYLLLESFPFWVAAFGDADEHHLSQHQNKRNIQGFTKHIV